MIKISNSCQSFFLVILIIKIIHWFEIVLKSILIDESNNDLLIKKLNYNFIRIDMNVNRI